MIFVDSSAWIGLMVTRDRHHEEARAAYEQLRETRHSLVTSDYVLNETYTRVRALTQNWRLLHRAHEYFLQAEEKASLLVHWTDKTIFDAARDLFMSWKDQNFSFVDCVSFVTARKLGIQECFSFDRDFLIAGLRLYQKKPVSRGSPPAKMT
ncbi:MAG: type II toxin-antitoxin system VapC family toxin [Armatimonadetes bacterium]|nr:type II toxin-antitoxin system VapC family toxin [Armatimonadota bacterium]